MTIPAFIFLQVRLCKLFYLSGNKRSSLCKCFILLPHYPLQLRIYWNEPKIPKPNLTNSPAHAEDTRGDLAILMNTYTY